MLTKKIENTGLQLRPPLLVILAFLIMFTMVSCHTLADGLTGKNGHRFLTANTISRFPPLRRFYKFYSHCSQRQIEVKGSSVTALGSPDSPNTKLILQSAHYHNHYGMHIIGERSGRFICFNRKSKLVTRFSGSSPRCIFQEEFSPDRFFTVLKSVFNPNWHVGFTKRGKPIAGSKIKMHRAECFYFTKRDHSYLVFKPYKPMISNLSALAHHLQDYKPVPKIQGSETIKGNLTYKLIP